MNFELKPFDTLSLEEFHDLIALRIKVFVIEQNCPYQDLDGKDKKSLHVIGRNAKGEILATARILPAGISYPEVGIGRVVVDPSERGTGAGHALMRSCMEFIENQFGKVPVRLSAQSHLEKFYMQHQFISTGKEYLEDGIPHVEMLYLPKNIL
jgi:ElaA protein